MRTALFTVTTCKAAPAAATQLQHAAARFGNVACALCVLDAPDNKPLTVQGCTVIAAKNLIGPDFLQKAFLYDRPALTNLCRVMLAQKLLQVSDAVVAVAPEGLAYAGEHAPVAMPLLAQADAVLAPCATQTENDRGLPVEFLLQGDQLVDDAFAAFGRGPKTQGFLQWCQQKFFYLQEKSNGLLMPLEECPGMRGQRSFLNNWLSYAQAYGCQVTLLPARKTLGALREERRMDFEKKAVTRLDYSYAFFKDGTRVHPLVRNYYERDYRLRQACGKNPFTCRKRICEESVILGDSHPVPLTALTMAIYQQRADLRRAFPSLAGDARMGYIEWFLHYGTVEYDVDLAYIAPVRAAYELYAAALREQAVDRRTFAEKIKQKMGRNKEEPPAAPVYPAGVNLCGFIRGDFGMGECARILARILEASGIPYTVVDYQGVNLHSYRNNEFAGKISNQFIYNTNLFVTNGDGLLPFFEMVDRSVCEGRYNIGYWAWELPEFPSVGWEAGFPLLDEVWTCSEFSAESIRQKSPVPVTTVPLAVTPGEAAAVPRAAFGLPEDVFIFLMMYDVRSYSERKNPAAAVKAFLKAFENDPHAMLVIKANAPADWNGQDALLDSVRAHANVRILVDTYPRETLNALLVCSDAFVSLHRSEGFGLGPAEAMYYAKPVVITNWSGNTQYMTADNCCAVDYTIVEIAQDYGPYKKGGHWAEPNTDDAARQMRRLVEDDAFYRAVAENGRRTVRSEFSPHALGQVMKARLAQIERGKAQAQD